MYDLIIIGSGTAGLTAFIYARRMGLKTLVIEKQTYGGQIINSTKVENFPGFISIDGFEFATKLYEQAKVYDLKIINDEVVELKKEEQFIIKTKKDTYKSLSVIIATGLAKRKLGLNEARFSNVSYCATCDGFFYKNKDVAIVGGGNTALEDAIFLSNICNKIYIINRSDKLRADDKLINQVKNNDNIKILYNSVIEKINGDKTITSITIDSKEIAIEGLFIAIGQIPQNQFLNNFVDLENGYVLSSDCKTNVNGLFVAGDCRTKEVRQLVTAASDGAISAVKAFEYIKTL